MRRLKYKLIFLIGIFFFGSCKKGFLDQTGETLALYKENYIKDLGAMSEYLNGIYLTFNLSWAGARSSVGYIDYTADNLKPAQRDNDWVTKYKWTQRAQTAIVSPIDMTQEWENGYQVIRSCSFLIEDVSKYRSENPVKADYMKGQALALRALMHFKLVNIFAQSYGYTVDASHPGIPYITTSDVSQNYTRQTVKEVYDRIIADFNAAIDLLSNNVTSDIRYLSQDAAKALLSRIYLFKGDYVNSLSLVKELVSRHPLMTITQGFPNGLFYNKPSTETEVLFQASPADYPAPTTNFLGRYLKSPIWFYATIDVANVITETSSDVRSNWVIKDGNNWMVTKFPSGVAGIKADKNSDYYEPVIRSSELFLIGAEASVKTGDDANARIYLNQLRKRSDPMAADVTLGGTELLNTIYKERRKELCFEGMRMFDLQRLKMGVNRTDVYDNAPTSLPYGSDHAVAPIPYKEIMIMGLKQNPGY